jgi:hypothetical protein
MDSGYSRLPEGVQERLNTLLDKQDGGQPLTDLTRWSPLVNASRYGEVRIVHGFCASVCGGLASETFPFHGDNRDRATVDGYLSSLGTRC